MKRSWPIPLLAIALLLAPMAAGCSISGGDDDEPEIRVAQSKQQWGTRLRPFLRRMGRNFEVLNALRDRRFRLLYVYPGNPETLRIVNGALENLAACTENLERVGRPPSGQRSLERAYDSLARSCPHYERLAALLLDAVPLLSSGDLSDRQQGTDLIADAVEPANLAAENFERGLRIIERERVVPGLRTSP